MQKKILAIYYSQSGQLGEIISNLAKPLSDAGHLVETVQVFPETAYPFPWKGKSFFAVMPDCVNGIPTALQTIRLQQSAYDLVIIGYQAWFLSPSIPCNSFLQNPAVKGILTNTPVVTVTGARNMWISAMERIKTTLKNSGAKLSGSIALVDKHPNFISFITIFHWMFRGKKDRYLNIFPKPGVSDADIAGCTAYGAIINQHLETGNWNGLQSRLIKAKAIEVKYNHILLQRLYRRR